MKTIFLILLSILSIESVAQITFRIEDNISYPDLSVKISDNVSYPDIRIKIGEDISYEDFTVGITSNKSKADFIITKSRYPDLTVKASDNISYPDLRIKAGESVSYADVTIEIKKSGTVDYLVYTEKAFISLIDIVISLLPAINKELDYKFEKIPIYIDNQGNENLTDAIGTLKGAKIFAQDDDNTYLGEISSEYDSESIFNKHGTYGNE